MTQAQLNRAVARATGESARTIARRGFSLDDPTMPHDPEPSYGPNLIDWDSVDGSRTGLGFEGNFRPAA